MYKDFTIILVHKLKVKSINDVPAPVIRLVTKCYYNHVAIVYRGYVFEANSKGFEPSYSVEEYIKRIGVDIEVALLEPKVLPLGAKERLKEIIGKGYDFWSLLWFQVILAVTGKWLGHTQKFAKEKVYCSEAIAYILDLFQWWIYTPKMLLDLDGKQLTLVYTSNITHKLNWEKKWLKRK